MPKDWSFHSVACAECGNSLTRRLINPNTGKPIKVFFCGFKCKGLWQKRQKPADENWLRTKYQVEGMDCVEIAKLVNRDPKSVWNWLKGYDIPTRSRGSNPDLLFKPGQPNAFAGKHHSDATKQKLRNDRLADGRFPKDGDAPYWRGKTGMDHPAWKGGHTPDRQAFYASDMWKSARKDTYARAKACCELCGISSRERKMHVHHIMPFSLFPRYRAERNNLELLCCTCHRWVHSPKNGDRKFLPWFGVYPVAKDGVAKMVRISYFPRHKATIPCWL